MRVLIVKYGSHGGLFRQRNWLFLYLKDKISFDALGSIKCMEPAAQRKALLDVAQYLKKLFYQQDDSVWRFLPGKELHRYGPWKLIGN